MLKSSKAHAHQVRQRAAEVRGNWSATERRRREGLPPDIPAKLRNYLMNWRADTSPELRGIAV